MARWEIEETDSFIEEADAEPDPRARLETLFGSVSRRRAPGEDRLYIAAVAEGVGDVVERVTRRRVDYVANALIELGVAPDEAHRRAVAGVAVVLGIEQLGRGGAVSVAQPDRDMGTWDRVVRPGPSGAPCSVRPPWSSRSCCT